MSAELAMWDPVSQLIIELREAPAVAAIVGANPTSEPPRVRGQEPAPGDVQGAATGFRAFVVVVSLGSAPHPQVPVQRPRHAVRCYGRTKLEAQALYAACFAAVHARGPRTTGAGHAIYVSHDDTGGDYGTDPDTDQPLYTFIVESLATTQVVA